jgi:hypothetical protein
MNQLTTVDILGIIGVVALIERDPQPHCERIYGILQNHTEAVLAATLARITK